MFESYNHKHKKVSPSTHMYKLYSIKNGECCATLYDEKDAFVFEALLLEKGVETYTVITKL